MRLNRAGWLARWLYYEMPKRWKGREELRDWMSTRGYITDGAVTESGRAALRAWCSDAARHGLRLP